MTSETRVGPTPAKTIPRVTVRIVRLQTRISPLPFQPSMGELLAVEREGDEDVPRDGDDDADEGRCAVALVLGRNRELIGVQACGHDALYAKIHRQKKGYR